MSLDNQKAKFGRFPEAPGAASTLPGTRENGTTRLGFKATDFVVYPAHGVGQIVSIEEQTVAGARLEFFVIFFKKSKMTVRVPVRKAANVRMRKPSKSLLGRRSETDSEPISPERPRQLVPPCSGI